MWRSARSVPCSSSSCSSFQAGLSSITILRKREAFRRAFRGSTPSAWRASPRGGSRRCSATPASCATRGKSRARFRVPRPRSPCAGRAACPPWSGAPWEESPILNAWRSSAEVPSETEESRALSRALRGRGFAFVGPVTCYAFMQAAGLIERSPGELLSPRRGEAGKAPRAAPARRPGQRGTLTRPLPVAPSPSAASGSNGMASTQSPAARSRSRRPRRAGTPGPAVLPQRCAHRPEPAPAGAPPAPPPRSAPMGEPLRGVSREQLPGEAQAAVGAHEGDLGGERLVVRAPVEGVDGVA